LILWHAENFIEAYKAGKADGMIDLVRELVERNAK
jgi:hypothetical protein